MLALYVLATIFLTILVLLTTRWRVGFSSIRDGSTIGSQLQLRLLFGLLTLIYCRGAGQNSLQVLLFSRYLLIRKRLRRAAVHRAKARGRKTARRWDSRQWLSRVRRIEFSGLLQHLRNCISVLKRPRLRGHIVMGLSNPMHTGAISGLYASVGWLWPQLRRNLSLRPDFLSREITWQIDFSTEFVPARLAWHGVVLWQAVKKD